MTALGIGIVGCGTISGIYMQNISRFPGLRLVACADIREDAALRRLPVVILSTSGLAEDRIRSYDLGVNAYIRKPSGFAPLAEALRIIQQFWTLAERPE